MANERDERVLDVRALAIQQQLLDEWGAGQRPRLSAYVRRYPEYAGMLADLFATLPPEAQPVAAETLRESFPEHLWTGVGVGRALSRIFAASTRDDQRLPRVAEERGSYHTGAPAELRDADQGERE